MAKGQITEDSLRNSFGNPPGLDALTASRPKKDSPFRSTLSSPAAAETPVPASPVQQGKVVSLKPEMREPERAPEPQVTVPEPSPRVEEEKPVMLATSEETSKEEVASPEVAEQKHTRKLDIYTEKVSLKISPEMRDQVEALARGLQRQKTSKDERITANTVMRVAINVLLSKFKLDEDDVTNSEEELFELARKKVRSRG